MPPHPLPPTTRRTRVFLVCPGLGHVRRGYESFTQECFDALREDPSLELHLFQGAGPRGARVHTLPVVRREGAPARGLARVGGLDAYHLEQASFLPQLLVHVLRRRPEVVFFSDFLLGCWLAHARRRLGLRFALVFSNGAPNGPPFPLFDRVQQLLPVHREAALAAGEPADKHTLLPYGIAISGPPPTELERVAQRRTLGLPSDRPVLVCVAALNAAHKRVDRLIEEVATLRDRPLLVMLGQETPETPRLRALAQAKLGTDFVMKSVPHADVTRHLRAADLFVLASLSEGLPRVLLEAASQGLPVVGHDSRVNRESLGAFARCGDLSVPGVLARLVEDSLARPEPAAARAARADFVAATYGWPVLAPRYVEMLRSAAEAPARAGRTAT